MQVVLILARALHFGATISLAGIFAFECLVAAPALRAAGADHRAAEGFRRRLRLLAAASLGLALLSGLGWLVATTAEMSGKPLASVFSQGLIGVVLTGTRFGEDCLLRLACALLLGLLLVLPEGRSRRTGALRSWGAFGLAAAILASLAWAGHGAATAGSGGDLHLAADVLHLLAAGGWLGSLAPLALLLRDAGRTGGPQGMVVMRAASRRYSVLASVSVAILLAGGLVNTWFLSGSTAALFGTEYGRLLLAKIALFLAMLLVAAVNLLRLGPRFAASGSGRAAADAGRQLRRNALIEAALGAAVLVLVGILGILPPGLHEQPGWPLPFRIDLGALAAGEQVMLAVTAGLFCTCAVAAVIAAVSGRSRRAAVAGAALVLCGVAGCLLLIPAVEPAYPTSFYAPAEPYSTASIVRGAALYRDNCVACHGPTGRGDGPAAAGLPVRPADLTEPHLFAHPPGDLFWWVGNGRADGAMPGFAAALSPNARWDVINFIKARAAGDLMRQAGRGITSGAAYPVPDFAFEAGGRQGTLRRQFAKGPVLLVLFARPAPIARLRELAAAQQRLAGAGLHVLAVAIDEAAGEGASADPERAAPVVAVASDVKAVLRLFRAPGDGLETELMLDRNGDARARWTAASLPDLNELIVDATQIARVAAAAPSHAGHAQ